MVTSVMIWLLLVLPASFAFFAEDVSSTRCFECQDLPWPSLCTIVTKCAHGQVTSVMIWLLLVLPASFAFFAEDVSSTRCFECQDLPWPSLCTIVTKCAHGQQCVVGEFVTSGGLTLFNSGCMSASRCSQAGRRSVSNTSRSIRSDVLSRRSDVTICEECCDGNFCNNKGCGTAGTRQPDRGPLCFHCDYQNEPNQCRRVVQCDQGEVCMVTELSRLSPDGKPLYSSSCKSPPERNARRLSLVGRRRGTPCHTCCQDDFCNDKCRSATINTSSTVLISTTTGSPAVHITTPSITEKPVIHNTTTATVTGSTAVYITTPSNTLTPVIHNTTTTTATGSLAVHITTPSITLKPVIHSTTTKTTTTTTEPMTTTLNPSEKCRQHHSYQYDSHGNLCVRFHDDKQSWDHANNQCKNEGGYLAVADTQVKWDALKAAIAHHYAPSCMLPFNGVNMPVYEMTPTSSYTNRYGSHHGDVYLGARTPSDPHHYHWVTGASLSFQDWAHGEPHGHDQKCIYSNYEDGRKWHDTHCTSKFVYACEIPV